jgi:hypothetical protein
MEMSPRDRKLTRSQDVVLVCADILNLVKTLYQSDSFSLTVNSIPSGGITTFGPLIVKGFGFNAFNTILLNIPFGAVQIIATIGGAAFATWTKKKGPALALLCIPPIIGCVMLLKIDHIPSNKGPLLAAYYLVWSYHKIGNALI